MEGSKIRRQVKAQLASADWTLTSVVNEMNKKRDKNHQTTLQNISNKLSRGTIKYSEILEIAEIIGCEIKWER